MSHRNWFVTAGLALCLLTCGLAADSAALAAEREIVFEPPPSVTVRKTDGTSARGRLLGINEDEIKLRILNGSEIELELERVRVIRGGSRGKSTRRSAGQFEFQPTVETFDDLVQRIRSIPNAKLSGDARRVVGSAATPQFRSRPNAPSTSAGSGKGDDEDDGDARGLKLGRHSARPAEVEKPEAGSRRRNNNPFVVAGDPPTDAVDDDEPASPIAVIEIFSCPDCGNDLPAGFRSGGKCPNCGQTLVDADDAPDSAVKDPAARPKNPFDDPGGAAPREDRMVAPAGARRDQAPAAAEATEFSFSNMPLIAEIGIFVGFIAAGWFVLQRR